MGERGRKTTGSMLESLISTATSPHHSLTKCFSVVLPTSPLFSTSHTRHSLPMCTSKRFLSPSDQRLMPKKKTRMGLVVVAKYAIRRVRQREGSKPGHWKPKQSPPAHPERLLRLSDLRGYNSKHRPTFSLS